MSELTYLFAGVALLTGLITTISIWAPRRLWIKGAALASALLFMPTAYASLSQLLSLPKPAKLEWWLAHAKEATVLASSFRENQAIYVWLQFSGSVEPRAYALPWNRDLAEQLQTAEREAAANQTEVRMRVPFEPSLDDREPKFYAMPQPALPPKDPDPATPQFYQQPQA
jgi:hypothetical protein